MLALFSFFLFLSNSSQSPLFVHLPLLRRPIPSPKRGFLGATSVFHVKCEMKARTCSFRTFVSSFHVENTNPYETQFRNGVLTVKIRKVNYREMLMLPNNTTGKQSENVKRNKTKGLPLQLLDAISFQNYLAM